jgi:hypothetical protein
MRLSERFVTCFLSIRGVHLVYTFLHDRFLVSYLIRNNSTPQILHSILGMIRDFV